MRRRRHARPVTTRRPEDWGAAACQHHVSTLSAERPSTTIDRTQPPTVKVLLSRHIRSLSTTSHHAWNTFLNRVSQVRILPGAPAEVRVKPPLGALAAYRSLPPGRPGASSGPSEDLEPSDSVVPQRGHCAVCGCPQNAESATGCPRAQAGRSTQGEAEAPGGEGHGAVALRPDTPRAGGPLPSSGE
jgi:hypothetical protein